MSERPRLFNTRTVTSRVDCAHPDHMDRNKRNLLGVFAAIVIIIVLSRYFGLLKEGRPPRGRVETVIAIALFVLFLVLGWFGMKVDAASENCANCGAERPSSSPSLTGARDVPRIATLSWTCPVCGREG